ncbi:hypothetical protein C7M84_019094 [Penaeus vannamei]|uniref:Uncharacterized protein n=1 Tax=Penaeus vannamei TaxID=6689 RepID=A0A3R7SIY9_PENVA|nr:hypothetical protein C7M84_019094 [Penaeus vannamei]
MGSLRQGDSAYCAMGEAPFKPPSTHPSALLPRCHFGPMRLNLRLILKVHRPHTSTRSHTYPLARTPGFSIHPFPHVSSLFLQPSTNHPCQQTSHRSSFSPPPSPRPTPSHIFSLLLSLCPPLYPHSVSPYSLSCPPLPHPCLTPSLPPPGRLLYPTPSASTPRFSPALSILTHMSSLLRSPELPSPILALSVLCCLAPSPPKSTRSQYPPLPSVFIALSSNSGPPSPSPYPHHTFPSLNSLRLARVSPILTRLRVPLLPLLLLPSVSPAVTLALRHWGRSCRAVTAPPACPAVHPPTLLRFCLALSSPPLLPLLPSLSTPSPLLHLPASCPGSLPISPFPSPPSPPNPTLPILKTPSLPVPEDPQPSPFPRRPHPYSSLRPQLPLILRPIPPHPLKTPSYPIPPPSLHILKTPSLLIPKTPNFPSQKPQPSHP